MNDDFERVLNNIRDNCKSNNKKELLKNIDIINEMAVNAEDEDNFILFIKESNYFDFNKIMIKNCKIISNKDFFLALNDIRDEKFLDNNILNEYLEKDIKFENHVDRYSYYHGLVNKFIYIKNYESLKIAIEKESI